MRKSLEIEIRIVRRKLSQSAVRALTGAQKYDWILFTSKNAVNFFAQELRERQIVVPKKPRIGAVGEETAKAARKAGLFVDVVPVRATVDDLLKKLDVVKRDRVLFPRSAIAPQGAVQILRKRGAHVTVIPLYTTLPKELSKTGKRALLAGAYSRIIFKSPSGVKGLLGQLTQAQRKIVLKIPIQCIGETTARTARTKGFTEVSVKSV